MIEHYATGSYMRVDGNDYHHIRIIAEETAKAVSIFNRLNSDGKDVAGAFHLTC